jgi:hypothetical protein
MSLIYINLSNYQEGAMGIAARPMDIEFADSHGANGG